MTNLRKAAEMAIEAIMKGGVKEQSAAVYELRQAIEQTEKREWQGLTDEDHPAMQDGDWAFRAGAEWAEAKLKEKNT